MGADLNQHGNEGYMNYVQKVSVKQLTDNHIKHKIENIKEQCSFLRENSLLAKEIFSLNDFRDAYSSCLSTYYIFSNIYEGNLGILKKLIVTGAAATKSVCPQFF